MFDKASGFLLDNCQLNDNSNHYYDDSTSGENSLSSLYQLCLTRYLCHLGLQQLYHASIPAAAHDSSARKYSPKCLPGTRKQHIEDFTSWASRFIAGQDRRFPMTWMSGPAGAGKSAIAQTCAEKIGKDKLGTAFFFSQPNQVDDPDRFFPSIAFQLSTKNKLFSGILNEKIREDPSLLSKTIDVQFQELIVAPLVELKKQSGEMQDRLVIIDGLDECESDDEQCVIVDVIATAIREHGENLPLLWAFFSRPEPHIVRTFASDHVSSLCWSTTLPVSHEVDEDIRLYLQCAFENIQKRRQSNHANFPSDTPWPSEEDITALVHMSGGLFAYPATVVKFVGDPKVWDVKEQLRVVLSLRSGNDPSTSN